MMTEILKAYDDVAVTAMKVSQLRGEANRISELTGYLDEKAKAYREEGDILGAEAIELIILDDLGSGFDSVYSQFQEEIKTWEQKYKRFENVCTYYGVSVPTLKDNNVIQFRKGVKQ
ncbi:hypothetical protein [Staphylococcus haemolyticus]|uniref:hypothetical protein n=1 Tax=Staphylococcus haemolyticus TaxID=1283 RepID=UPI000D1E7FC1|nr:hypothetical protein [Staphylococcus haemolyticus]PTK61292.1 hypothetical protein BUZ36_08165 [Staphylococcus haemolyticus]PTK80533.1 hypothetical protein BUZ21_09725 [Staphylococcus haemolyticus]